MEERAEVFVVSDGTGETAAALSRAAMAQFRTPWRLRTFTETRTAEQARRVVTRAREAGALLVFTLVDKKLVAALREAAEEQGVPVVDLLGPLLASVGNHLHAAPLGEPGLLHGLSDAYFERIAAVEFAVRHDDGANLHSLSGADLVLTGVSRTSKTPLSMYLAQRGLKTGNVPLLPGIEPPRELLDMDRRKVVALLVSAEALADVRRARIRALGASPYASYADPDVVVEELRHARRLIRDNGWRSVEITGRAVEENAARILELLEGD